MKNFNSNNGQIECWEYMKCNKTSCCAHISNETKFHFFREKTLCGDRYDETIFEWLVKSYNILNRKVTKTVLQPVFMLLGR